MDVKLNRYVFKNVKIFTSETSCASKKGDQQNPEIQTDVETMEKLLSEATAWSELKGAVRRSDTTTLSWVWNLVISFVIASKVMQISLVSLKISLKHFLRDKPTEFDVKTMFYWYAHR